MDIIEFNERLHEAESEILSILRKLEGSTGMEVGGIRLDRVQMIGVKRSALHHVTIFAAEWPRAGAA